MRIILKALIISLITISCGQKEIHNVICEIEGLKSDTALIAFVPLSNEDNMKIDTVKFSNGILKYNANISELNEAFIIPIDLVYKFDNGKSYPLPSSRVNFFIDTLEQVKIVGIINEQVVDYEVTGNRLSEQLSESRKMKLSLFKERIEFEYKYNSLKEDKNSEKDYWNLRDENNRKYQDKCVEYISNNPNSEYSAMSILEIHDKSTSSNLYHKLTENVKNSYFGVILGDMVNGWALHNPGVQFPNIESKTLNGEMFNLKDYKGKYVLIDFWGTWCAPCIAEIPQLKEINKKYKSDLQLVGIACKDDREKLKHFIHSKSINWIQVEDGKERKTKYSQRFGIKSYPTKILLDREGKVIKSYVGMDENLFNEIENLMK